MAIFETILVPTDYSDNAKAALATAAHLASELGSSLRVAHVRPRSAVREAVKGGMLATGDDDESLVRRLREKHEKTLEEFVSAAGLDAAQVERVVLLGDPSREIVAYARANAVDLIVIGRRGVTLADVMLGSVAERVVRHADCPVLIVKRSGV
jgi:nucleotide-binding universal stress UspA family protein